LQSLDSSLLNKKGGRVVRPFVLAAAFGVAAIAIASAVTI